MPHRIILLTFTVVFLCLNNEARSCESIITIKLENNQGGFFVGQKVILTSKVDGKVFEQKSNDRGEAIFKVPCTEMFLLTISNYTKTVEIESPDADGRITQGFSYAPDMIQKQKLLAMNSQEQQSVDDAFVSLPDTTLMSTSIMQAPSKNPNYYTMVMISIKDIKGAALANETLTLSGRKRKKVIKATTDKFGRIIAYLPKGDQYDIGFKHNKNYYQVECAYQKGSNDIKIGFSYLGTKEIERRNKEEEERIRLEEERIKREREAFEKRCADLGLTLEDCHKKELEIYLEDFDIADSVITVTMHRNDWKDLLVVCDVTGSMSPYVAQIALWYRLRYKADPRLQFVFFNDGDEMPDEEKKIGATGGIYYSKWKGVNSLDSLMTCVQAKGSGGDAPENNIEALIKGVSQASPFKELVMIADNNAPVKDIELISSFKTPVHIIVCGSTGGSVHPDYLKIAWKTKGTIHTMERDILSLARLSEGQILKIGEMKYKIMGGDFIQMN